MADIKRRCEIVYINNGKEEKFETTASDIKDAITNLFWKREVHEIRLVTMNFYFGGA